MASAFRLRLSLLVTFAAMMPCGACTSTVRYQSSGDVEATNDLPNPYQSIAPWGNLPEGRKREALNGVAVDNDGESAWGADRCGLNPDVPPGCCPFTYDSAEGSSVLAVLMFNSSGKLLKTLSVA